MQTFETVRRLLQEVKAMPDAAITPESTPEQLQMDALDVAELIMAVEEEFDILIADEDAVKTLRDLVTRVKAQSEVA